MRLTDPVIANERYRGEPFTDEGGRTTWPPCVLWDDEIEGFGVRIYPPVRGRPSRKDFIVTWRIGLKSRTMAIGTYRVDCTLRQARRAAREAIDLARRGRDPIEARQVALGIGTAEDLASRFLFEHTAAKKKVATEGEPSQTTADGGENAALGASGEEMAPGASGAGAAPAAPIAAEGSERPAAAGGGEVQTPAAAASSTAQAASLTGEDPLGEARSASPPAAEPPILPVESAEIGAAVEKSTAAETSTAAEPAPAGGAAASVAPPAESLSPAAGVPCSAPSDLGTGGAPASRLTHERPSRPSRGHTKMRLWSVPDALYRDIEHRARALGLSMTAYVRTLLERDVITPSLEGVLQEVEARQTADPANAAGEPTRTTEHEARRR